MKKDLEVEETAGFDSKDNLDPEEKWSVRFWYVCVCATHSNKNNIKVK